MIKNQDGSIVLSKEELNERKTEQEQIAAIDALVARSVFVGENVTQPWKDLSKGAQESLRHGLINVLRNMYDKGILDGVDICYHILGKHWTDATSEEAAICENAASTMKEVIEEER